MELCDRSFAQLSEEFAFELDMIKMELTNIYGFTFFVYSNIDNIIWYANKAYLYYKVMGI